MKFSRSLEPSLRIVWGDPFSSPAGSVTGGSSGSGWQMPANTHGTFRSPSGPDGGNFAMVDGHAEWRAYDWDRNVCKQYKGGQYFMYKR